MSTAFSEVHDELRSVARDALSPGAPQQGDGGAPAPLDWRSLADLGWLGLEVPEELGGAGATFAESAIVLEELGRAAAVSPFFGSAVLGIGALASLDAGPVRDALLTRVAAGELRLATALGDGRDDEADPSPAFAFRGGVLHGEAHFVADAPEADELLLLARDEHGRPTVVGMPAEHPGLTITPQPLVDATRSVGIVVADGAAIDPASVWSFGDDGARRVFARGAVALACDALGVSKAMLDATVAYAGARTQFGRPIGSFQAVKHACADLLVQVAVGEQLVAAAVRGLVDDEPDAWVAAARAKSHVTAAAVDVAGKALQLHGGIGYTWESGIHVYLKRAILDRSLLGSPRAHRHRLAERLLSLGA